MQYCVTVIKFAEEAATVELLLAIYCIEIEYRWFLTAEISRILALFDVYFCNTTLM